MEELNEIVRLSYLYDFYGPLLKERHRQMFEEYVLDDLSLSEIAEQHDITRQGVHDVVKRCSKKLEDYEASLQLFRRFQEARIKLGQMEELVQKEPKKNEEDILCLIHDIYDIL